jgi:hypothetical protein
MSAHHTHLIQTHGNKSMLSRSTDGMLIALRDGNKITCGEDPRQRSMREFIDDKHAEKAMRRVANEDQMLRKGQFCKDCGSVPAQAIVCEANNDGAHRIEYEGAARIKEEDVEERIARVH